MPWGGGPGAIASPVDASLASVSLRAQTLYSVKAEVSPPAGTEHCRTGALCSLEVCITRLSGLLEADQDEALTGSDEYFSTKLMYEGGLSGLPHPAPGRSLSFTACLEGTGAPERVPWAWARRPLSSDCGVTGPRRSLRGHAESGSGSRAQPCRRLPGGLPPASLHRLGSPHTPWQPLLLARLLQ